MPFFARRPWQRLGQLISQYEKILLAVLSLVIIVSGSIWFRQFASSHDGLPSAGGTYVEGIVGGLPEVEAIAAKVTKVGLFVVDENGQLQNQLVSDWQANAERTEYRFQLLGEVEPKEIQTDLEKNIDLLGEAGVELNGQELIIRLAAPNPNIPLLLAQPLFDYGPYKVSKLSNETTILTRNTRAKSVKAFINKVIIHAYPDEEALKNALKKRRVDGAVLNDEEFLPDGFGFQEIPLSRYYVLIFNINKTPFRDAAVRRQAIEAQNGDNKSFTLTVAEGEPYQTLGTTLVDSWQKAGFNVTLQTKRLDEIQQQIAPSRDFQALLTGISYGGEIDPYYLWHSTQIRPPGNNLSGVKSEKIDAAIDQLRQTYNVAERQKLIDGLHMFLKEEAVAVILRQETGRFVLSDGIRFSTPFLAVNIADRWQSIAKWSVK